MHDVPPVGPTGESECVARISPQTGFNCCRLSTILVPSYVRKGRSAPERWSRRPFSPAGEGRQLHDGHVPPDVPIAAPASLPVGSARLTRVAKLGFAGNGTDLARGNVGRWRQVVPHVGDGEVVAPGRGLPD